MPLQRSATRRVDRATSVRRVKKTAADLEQGVEIIYEGRKPEVDIVFVPGLGADPVNCWTSASGFNWVTGQDGLQRDFPNARFLLYHSVSSWSGPLKVHQSMQNLSSTLLHGIKGRRPDPKQRPIVFIGHSMGGLVIAKALSLADSQRNSFSNIIECTAGCVFFGAPFGGASPASAVSLAAHIGEYFNQTTARTLIDLMSPGNQELKELKEQFVRLRDRWSQNLKTQVFCFYEQVPTDFAKDVVKLMNMPAALQKLVPKGEAEFVSADSATIVGIDSMGIVSTHRDMVKFKGVKDQRYSLVRGCLNPMIQGAKLLVDNRFNSIRDVDNRLVQDVLENFEGSEVKKRNTLNAKNTASSWLTKEQEYLDWHNFDSSGSASGEQSNCLWVRGPVGRGKTSNTLAALNHIEHSISADVESFYQNSGLLAYYFCEAKADESTAEALLKSLLYQLVKQRNVLATYARHFVKKNSRPASPLTVENMWQVLQDMLADDYIGERVYFVISNLHFLPEDANSTMTLMKLMSSELQTEHAGEHRSVKTQWLISSRNTHYISQTLTPHRVRLIDLDDDKYSTQAQLDLWRHAQIQVSLLKEKKHYTKALAYFASNLIGRRAQNIHWIDIACLHLKELDQHESDMRIREMLQIMPQDLTLLLDQAWEQVFLVNKLQVEKIKEILRALIVTYEDPTDAELAMLAGMNPATPDHAELGQLVGACKPLVVRRYGRVTIMNHVVKKHLLDNAAKHLGLTDETIAWHHGVLAHRCFCHCMEALNFSEIELEASEFGIHEVGTDKDYAGSISGEDNENDTFSSAGNDDPHSNSDDHSFPIKIDKDIEKLRKHVLDYTVKYWLRHAGEATPDLADELTEDDQFWKPESSVRRRWLTLYNYLTGCWHYTDLDLNMPALHIAASVGFAQLVATLVRKGHEDELQTKTETDGRTPLHYAAYFGHADIVEELLSHATNINEGRDEHEDTPLEMAAARGNVQVMKRLISRGADVNSYSEYYYETDEDIEADEADSIDEDNVDEDNGDESVADENGEDGNNVEEDNDEGSKYKFWPVINSAISSGNPDAVKLLVENGASLAPEGDNMDRPLALAAQLSEIAMFEYLIHAYAEKLPQEEYNYAFVSAAEYGRMEVLQKLIQYNPPLESFQEALDKAAYEGYWEVARFLLKERQGLDCAKAFTEATSTTEDQDELLKIMWTYTNRSIPTATLEAALCLAIKYDKAHTLRVLLDDFGVDINADVEEFGTALTVAAEWDNMEILKVLLARGAEVDDSIGYPLHIAAKNGQEDIVKELLLHGADVNRYTTFDGFIEGTALQAACAAGWKKTVGLLLAHNADPNKGRGPLTCPLIAAIENGHSEIVELLLKNVGVNANIRGGPNSAPPLVTSAKMMPQSTLERLIDAGADVNGADINGNTALILAAEVGERDCVQFLLLAGADVLHTNTRGMNAAQVALQENSYECATVLVDHISNILSAIKVAADAANTTVTGLVQTIGTSIDTTRITGNDAIPGRSTLHYQGTESVDGGWRKQLNSSSIHDNQVSSTADTTASHETQSYYLPWQDVSKTPEAQSSRHSLAPRGSQESLNPAATMSPPQASAPVLNTSHLFRRKPAPKGQTSAYVPFNSGSECNNNLLPGTPVKVSRLPPQSFPKQWQAYQPEQDLYFREQPTLPSIQQGDYGTNATGPLTPRQQYDQLSSMSPRPPKIRDEPEVANQHPGYSMPNSSHNSLYTPVHPGATPVLPYSQEDYGQSQGRGQWQTEFSGDYYSPQKPNPLHRQSLLNLKGIRNVSKKLEE